MSLPPVLVVAAAEALGAAGALAAVPAPAPDAMTASLPLASTVLPSAAMISDNVPAAGAGTSTLTLSVSSSQSISSWATVSPTALNHVATVASVTDSPKVGTITSTAEPPPDAGASAGASAGFSAGAAAPSEILASSALTPTVSPSPTTMSDRVPAAGLGTSTVTLSVSSSQSISSTATASPGFLNHVATVASVTDSPSVGTRTSVMVYFPLSVSASSTRAACCALCWLARPVAGEAAAARPA